ncbi:MAG TPA: hypothetical protein ENG16_01000 [Archaeoglobus sp.]|nr:hypothetical protein [Archaeoglobus sp.]
MKRKIGVTFVLCTLAFAGIGVGYANWSEELTIEGSVTMGSIDPKFLWVGTNDPPTPGSNDPKECGEWNIDAEWDGERYDWDVGSISAYKNPQDPSQLYITVENAYPCYYGSVLACIKNAGTVPVGIESIKLKIGSNEWSISSDTVYYVDFDTGTVQESPFDGADLSLELSGISVGSVIDPNEETHVIICVHVEEGAQQSARYDFDIQIDFCNWNEVS